MSTMAQQAAQVDLDELAQALAGEDGSWWEAGPEERDRYRRLADVARDALWLEARTEAQRLGRLRGDVLQIVVRLEKECKAMRRKLDELEREAAGR
jgi:hypothetical protein